AALRGPGLDRVKVLVRHSMVGPGHDALGGGGPAWFPRRVGDESSDHDLVRIQRSRVPLHLRPVADHQRVRPARTRAQRGLCRPVALQPWCSGCGPPGASCSDHRYTKRGFSRSVRGDAESKKAQPAHFERLPEVSLKPTSAKSEPTLPGTECAAPQYPSE